MGILGTYNRSVKTDKADWDKEQAILKEESALNYQTLATDMRHADILHDPYQGDRGRSGRPCIGVGPDLRGRREDEVRRNTPEALMHPAFQASISNIQQTMLDADDAIEDVVGHGMT